MKRTKEKRAIHSAIIWSQSIQFKHSHIRIINTTSRYQRIRNFMNVKCKLTNVLYICMKQFQNEKCIITQINNLKKYIVRWPNTDNTQTNEYFAYRELSCSSIHFFDQHKTVLRPFENLPLFKESIGTGNVSVHLFDCLNQLPFHNEGRRPRSKFSFEIVLDLLCVDTNISECVFITVFGPRCPVGCRCCR